MNNSDILMIVVALFVFQLGVFKIMMRNKVERSEYELMTRFLKKAISEIKEDMRQSRDDIRNILVSIAGLDKSK